MCKQALQLQKDCSSSLHLRALECHCHFSPNSQIHALKSHTIFSTFPKLSHLTAVCLCHHAPLKVQQKYNKQCFIEVNYLLTTSTIQQYVRTDLTKSSWRIIQYKIQIPVQGSFQSPYIASDSEIQYFSLQQPSVRQSFKHASFFSTEVPDFVQYPQSNFLRFAQRGTHSQIHFSSHGLLASLESTRMLLFCCNFVGNHWSSLLHVKLVKSLFCFCSFASFGLSLCIVLAIQLLEQFVFHKLSKIHCFTSDFSKCTLILYFIKT